jgi:arylsulfatase A
MVRRMDAGIGRLLATLDRLGLAGNTLICFTSDNGPVQGGNVKRFNTNLAGGKCTVWEGGIRVPMIVRWPDGIEGGRTCPEMAHFADWPVTLLSAAGLACPADWDHDGCDLMGILQGRGGRTRIRRFWQWTRYEVVPMHNAAMRDGKWKLLCPAAGNYILNLDSPAGYTDAELGDYVTMVNATDPRASGIRPPRREGFDGVEAWADHLREVVTRPKPTGAKLWPPAPKLFDLEVDPGEQHDLSEAHPEVVSRMRTDLENWFETLAPQWQRHIDANPYYPDDPVGARAAGQSPGQWDMQH